MARKLRAWERTRCVTLPCQPDDDDEDDVGGNAVGGNVVGGGGGVVDAAGMLDSSK